MRHREICRESRRRKKQYVVELENKVDYLEEKVGYLNEEIGNMKKKMFMMASGLEVTFKDYMDNYKELSTRIIAHKYLNEDNKGSDFFDVIKHFEEETRPQGIMHTKIFRSLMKNIFEHIVPDFGKLFVSFSSNISDASSSQYSKLFEMTKQTALAKLREPMFNEIDKILYETDVSADLREHLLQMKP